MILSSLRVWNIHGTDMKRQPSISTLVWKTWASNCLWKKRLVVLVTCRELTHPACKQLLEHEHKTN